MASLQDVRDRARALLGDPDGDWATDGYLDPFINQVYGVQILYLAGSCSTLQEKVITIAGGVGPALLPLGATSLGPYQKKGGLLEGLETPLELNWKVAGQPVEQYCEIWRVARLPHVSPVSAVGGTNIGRMSYEWRGKVVYLTPNSQLIDIEVRGEFRAAKLLKPDDELLDDRMLEGVAFGTSGIAGVERGNQAYTLTYGSEAMNTLDDVAADLIRGDQRVRTRLGSVRGRGRR